MYLQNRKPKSSSVLCLKFASNSLNILVGTGKGYQVYRTPTPTTKPQKILSRENDLSQPNDSMINQPGGISAIDVLEATNIVALVAGGRYPKFNINTLILFDDSTQKPIFEVEFNTPVCSVRIYSDRVVVFLLTKIVVYSLDTVLKKLYEFDMFWNEYSIADISASTSDIRVLAFPAKIRGQIQIAEIQGGWTKCSSVPFTCRILGHHTAIAQISVSNNGTSVATASVRGTLIRVWDSKSGVLKHELRRGVDSADIYSIAFDVTGTRMCCISDKGTLHLFNLLASVNSLSKNTIMTTYLPKYFTSDWSDCTFSVAGSTRSIVQFVDGGTTDCSIHVLGSDGSLSLIQFDILKGTDFCISQDLLPQNCMSVTFHTDVGDIKIEVFCEETPRTAENFLALCASNYYLGNIFHRNIKGFIVQTGDPTMTGKGGQSIWNEPFEDEFVPSLKHHTRGTIAMANKGPNTNGSQFYITYSKQSHLDGVNTVFGKVIDGMDALEILERVPTDPTTCRPRQDIRIKEIIIHANPIAK